MEPLGCGGERGEIWLMEMKIRDEGPGGRWDGAAGRGSCGKVMCEAGG